MAGWYKEQIGPLPAGAWVAVVGGGLGIAMWSRRHPAPAAPNTDVAPSADLGPTALPDYSTGGGGSSSPSPLTPPIVTNEDWQRIASSALILHGYDPLTVTRALTDYLAGQPLDAKETAAVEEALREVGPPPLPPPNPGSISTTPPPSTAPPPDKGALGVIEQGYYGEGYGPLTGNDWAKGLTEKPVPSVAGGQYEWLPNAQAVVAAKASGQTVYIEIAPGVFVPANNLPAVANTPTYVRVG